MAIPRQPRKVMEPFVVPMIGAYDVDKRLMSLFIYAADGAAFWDRGCLLDRSSVQARAKKSALP